MTAHEPSKYALQAEFFRALAHPLRLGVFGTLRGGEKCVSEIAKSASASQANISRHLARMEWAGILTKPKEGLHVFYRLRSSLPCVNEFLNCTMKKRVFPASCRADRSGETLARKDKT